MKSIIRIGDATTSDGRVLAGSDARRFDGIGAARQGDPVSCPLPGHPLRTELGCGPLTLWQLRGFELPKDIFLTDKDNRT
jgi:hypothetical protein